MSLNVKKPTTTIMTCKFKVVRLDGRNLKSIEVVHHYTATYLPNFS